MREVEGTTNDVDVKDNGIEDKKRKLAFPPPDTHTHGGDPIPGGWRCSSGEQCENRNKGDCRSSGDDEETAHSLPPCKSRSADKKYNGPKLSSPPTKYYYHRIELCFGKGKIVENCFSKFS